MRKKRWIIRLLFLAAVAVGVSVYMRGPDIAPGSYLVLDISGAFPEGRPGRLIDQVLDRQRTFLELVDNLRKAGHDGRIGGVVVRVSAMETGWGHAREIREALGALKSQGKRVVALVEGELDAANKQLYVASIADKVYVPPAATITLNGLSSQHVFLGDVWEKAYLSIHVEQIREYKTAGDSLSRSSMSEAHRNMATWLLDTVDQEFVDTLAAGRNLTPAEIRGIIARAPASGPELVEAGVVDGVKSYDEVLAELGDGEAPPIVDERDYSTVSLKSLGLAGGARIAVIHAAGGIVTGHGRPGREEVASRDVAEALRSAARDESIKAIVLRIDSPGGSAAASDEIWLAAREVGAAKPLVASMADVAASGGYYIASAADRIVAQPTTITGSIGVVLFKPYVTDLLDEVGVHTESITRGRFARYMDLTKRFDDEELALVRRQMNDIYELFVTRVSTGRGLDTQAVDRIGGGRVWTGSQALERGLVDELGGIRRAIALAAEAADVGAPDKVELVHYPKAGGIVEEILAAGAHVAAQRPAIEILEPVTRMLTAWVPPVGISTSMAVVPEMR